MGRRSVKVFRYVMLLLVLLFAVAWFTGAVGYVIRILILPSLTPVALSPLFQISDFGSDERVEHEKRGVALIISPERADAILKGAFPVASRFVPPGIFVHGFVIHCLWQQAAGSSGTGSLDVIPLWVMVDENSGHQPVLKGRMPVDEVNAYFAEDIEDSLASKERWIFGSYIIRYRISFDSMRILSDTGTMMADGKRSLSLQADGRVRITFDDKPISARTTARIREIKGNVEMFFVPHDDGYALVYDAEITDLNINVKNLLNWGDRKVSESLRRSLEKSLNRGKTKKRALKLRIPEWVPRDVIIDLQLSKSAEEGAGG